MVNGMDNWDVPFHVHIKHPHPISTQFAMSSPTKPWFLGGV